MIIAKEKDFEQVAMIMCHPAVWRPFSNDAGNETHAAIVSRRFLVDPRCLVMLPNVGSVFIAEAATDRMCEGHVACLPKFRGHVAVEVANVCIKWVFDHSDFKKILVRPMTSNKAACAFADLLGFSLDHTIKRAAAGNVGMCIYTKEKPNGEF